MNEHLMQKEKAVKSESNHYQFHAISLASFSNISSIPISTRMKMEKAFFWLVSFLQFNNSHIANFMYVLLYTHVSWHVGEYLEMDWDIMDIQMYIFVCFMYRGKLAKWNLTPAKKCLWTTTFGYLFGAFNCSIDPMWNLGYNKDSCIALLICFCRFSDLKGIQMKFVLKKIQTPPKKISKCMIRNLWLYFWHSTMLN